MASWTTRPLGINPENLVDVMAWPEAPVSEELGLPKLGVFSRLKASARNCNEDSWSGIAKLLNNDISSLLNPGPVTPTRPGGPKGITPAELAAIRLPAGAETCAACGGFLKAHGLNHFCKVLVFVAHTNCG